MKPPKLHELVIASAREVHGAHWRMSGEESTGDKLAKFVTDAWQRKLSHHSDIAIEFSVADHLRERIDVVDTAAGVAYEMKVSPNNVHMEFYRDIFKVLLARDHRLPQLNRFVFLTPKKGADYLSRGMGKAISSRGAQFGLQIDVVSL